LYAVESFASFDVFRKQEFPQDLNQFDLYMLTGSRASAYDDAVWIHKAKDFVRLLDRQRAKVLGICFGHQLIAESLNGKVAKNPNGWEVGWANFAFTPYAQKALQVLNPNQTVDLYYTHQDAVIQIPPGFESLGGNAATEIQGMAKGNHIITLQGHPEFPREVLATLISRREDRWSEEFVKDARESLEKPPNEVYILERMLKYLHLLPDTVTSRN